MEKIRVGWEMSTRWDDPPMILMSVYFAGLICYLFTSIYAAYLYPWCFWFPPLVIVVFWKYVMHAPEYCESSKYLQFVNSSDQKYYQNRKIPIAELWEMYIDGKVSFKGDVFTLLRDDYDKFANSKITAKLLLFLLEQFIPGSSSFKDKFTTKRMIADHYDRGNDFFEAFLGPRMVYTSGVFRGLDQSLETAQDNKMQLICDKLQLSKDQTFLDIGCGWGTLARYAVHNYPVKKSVGVTLSQEGASWCRQKNIEEKVKDKCEILYCDYRDIQEGAKFDKIASIEMAEHVGLVNFQLYLNKVQSLMTEDGMFLMQVAGLRQGSTWADVMWGLFMSKYIFPGADASTPLNWYLKQLEIAGFEVHSVETIGRHYSHTLHRWYKNWLSNRDTMESKYGKNLYRLWEFFLGYSAAASGVGTASCYQILAHKNKNSFPRDIWCSTKGVTSTSNAKTVGVGLA